MVIRISGEGQYEVPDEEGAALNELDDAVLAARDAGDAQAFASGLAALIARVREKGTLLAAEDLRGSDAILPPADLTLDEVPAHEGFTGEGLIPD